MGFDMSFANAVAERDSAASSFRLNIFGMADARRRLQEADVLDWGACKPLAELQHDPENEMGEYEAFQKRLQTWCTDMTDEDLTREAAPGRAVAAKLLFNDGQNVTPAECVAIKDALSRAPESYLQEFALWCGQAASYGGFIGS